MLILSVRNESVINMLSPPAMFLEAAQGQLSLRPSWLVESQLHELRGFGDQRAKQIGASGLSTDFIKGYEFGLEVARAVKPADL